MYGRQRRFHESAALYNPQEAEALLALVTSLLNEQSQAPPTTAADSMSTKSLVAALLGTEAGDANAAEVEVAAPVRKDEVGVICMSRAQAICVRNLLREEGFGEVNVGTVDDFQGQELRVIFVSSVLSHRVHPTHPVQHAMSWCLSCHGFFNRCMLPDANVICEVENCHCVSVLEIWSAHIC